MTDILIIQRANGGDINISGYDIETVQGFENMPYLSMFAGSADWWGNFLLDADYTVDSKTMVALRQYPLTSNGKLMIERAINTDLNFLKDISGTTYTLKTVINQNRLDIYITINGKTFAYNWNPSTQFLNYTL